MNMKLFQLVTFSVIYCTRTAAASQRVGESLLEAARYSSYPPTVFAPGGRLYGVERVAKEALLLDGADDDAVSCGTFALHCGRNKIKRSNVEDDDDDEEFAVMVGIGATSPYLHRDEAHYLFEQQESIPPLQQQQQLMDSSKSDGSMIINIGDDTTNENECSQTYYIPLTIDEPTTVGGNNIRSSPLSILSPTLIAGVGGKAIDSIILQRRATEVALSMYSNDNGGVDWFVSHSLEGTEERGVGEGGSSSSLRPIVGGAAGVDVSSLVRRVADMAQSSTQSLGGRYGRMLSSSLLAIGARTSNSYPNNINEDKLILWRVDPTGQFWRLDASAVGRGAINVESELLTRVQKWKTGQEEEFNTSQLLDENLNDMGADDEKEESALNDLSNDDIQSYLASLSVEEAVDVAKHCFVEGIMARSKFANTKEQMILKEQIKSGLRKRLQVVVIRSSEETVGNISIA